MELATIKSCFVFRSPSEGLAGKIKRFRDPDGLHMARKIVNGLRAQGFQATDGEHGMACDGGFRVSFPEFSIEVALLVKRYSHEIEAALLTWSDAPRQAVLEEWAQVVAAINEILKHDPSVTALAWLTRQEFEALFTPSKA